MASRRFFTYDPYDYYYTTPYRYSYPNYYPHAPARNDKAFFPDGEPAVRAAVHPSPYGYYHQPVPARAPERQDNGFFPEVGSPEPAGRAAVHPPRPRSSRSVSVPVHFAGSESELEPKRETAEMRVPVVADAAVPKKQAPLAEVAVVTVQAAARGFLARRMVWEVRAVEREAEGLATRVAAEAEALRGDARARIAVGEELMRLLLRLDAVRGVREYRRRVTKRVLALQDAVDALEHNPAPVTDMQAAGDALEAEIVETAKGEQVTEEKEMAEELPHAAEQSMNIGAKIAVESAATETAAEMEVDGGRITNDEAIAPCETELVVSGEKAQEAGGEWEMVTEEDAAESPAPKAEGGAADGLDAKKVMEMMAKLCEQSTKQCAVIGALAEQVDVLERAVRRVEEADRRRRRNKKLKEGKGNSKAARSCYSD